MFDAEDKCGQGRAEPSGVCVPVALALQLGQHRGSVGSSEPPAPKHALSCVHPNPRPRTVGQL